MSGKAILMFLIVVFSFIGFAPSPVSNIAFAEGEEDSEEVNKSGEPEETTVAPPPEENDDSDNLRKEINRLNDDVEKKKKEASQINGKINQYKSLVANKKIESASLEDQMALLDNQIAKTEVGIEISEKEIRSLELQMKKADEQLAEMEEKMDSERGLLGSMARELYRRQTGKSILEILLSHSTFSDFFRELYAIASLQRRVNDTLGRIHVLHAELEDEQHAREERKADVSKKMLSLEVERRKLDDEMGLKNNILVETRSSELEYRYLLAELKREQNEASNEITYLERVLREKIILSDRVKDTNTVLSWPIEPSRGITAIFHDPDYPFRHIFEHPGIDIRAYQGTPVRAAAGGIVARAKNAGLGYSYIMVIHNNDISTVYGHISRIVVREDTFVERGEIIGYSGGAPGTPGAGRLTTGPHLHFETRHRGIPVNPMNYLLGF
ncbi:MAG: peptidoglycan DD-metalloendopeptidase family protein [Patescibacteria group bacterium]|nr:peptidoglycan DD-metalloendopeptidase family protein [Patescibacteria group bacterium]